MMSYACMMHANWQLRGTQDMKQSVHSTVIEMLSNVYCQFMLFMLNFLYDRILDI